MSSTPTQAKVPGGRLMRPINLVVERYIPSSLVFAIILTVVTMVLTLVVTDSGPIGVLRAWGDGLADLLAFMAQMAVMLLLGYIVANTRVIRTVLRTMAGWPKGRVKPYVFIALVTCVLTLVNWAVALVGAALLAREIAAAGRARGESVHFPLLVAAGYTAMLIWQMGYSAAVPLTAATAGSFVEETIGSIIPIGDTIFSWWSIAATVATVIVICLTVALLAPRTGDVVEMPEHEEADEEVTYEVNTPADRLDASRVLTLVPGLLLAGYLALHFADGGTLDLDIVNWSLLAAALLLTRNPFELLELTRRAAANVGEILLQFPIYAGIAGIMAGTDLGQNITDAFVSISTAETFGLLTFLSAAVVNFFIPTGGGQFAVQGPIMLSSGAELGVDPAVTVMAFSYGDQLTNMIQPFWALPLLAIAGLRLRAILGYTTMLMLTSGVVMAVTLLLIGSGV